MIARIALAALILPCWGGLAWLLLWAVRQWWFDRLLLCIAAIVAIRGAFELAGIFLP